MIRRLFRSYWQKVFFARKDANVRDHIETKLNDTQGSVATNLEPTNIEKITIDQAGQQVKPLYTLPREDDNLLECSVTQWKFGDWQSLIKMTRIQLSHHPDREKLAILVAAGHFQIGSVSLGKEFTETALAWGCSPRLVNQILIAGVHNSLGRAALLLKENDRAVGHFKESIIIGSPKSEVTLFVQARATEQIRQTNVQTLS